MTVTWRLYRTKQGAWIVYSDTAVNFTHTDRSQIEKRLMKYGVKSTEIETLFRDEANTGEGRITVPIGLDRLYEGGVLEEPE